MDFDNPEYWPIYRDRINAEQPPAGGMQLERQSKVVCVASLVVHSVNDT